MAGVGHGPLPFLGTAAQGGCRSGAAEEEESLPLGRPNPAQSEAEDHKD